MSEARENQPHLPDAGHAAGEHRPTGSFDRPHARGQRHGAGHPAPSILSEPRTWLIVLALVCAAIVVAVVADAAVSAGRIHPGVSIAGVPVGSLTPEQARVKLVETFTASSKKPVTITADSQSWKVTAAGIDAELDTTASVASAMAVGRSRGAWAMIADRIGATFGGIDVASHISAGPKLGDVLDKVAAAVTVPSKDASIAVSGSAVSFHAAVAGRALDTSATREAVLEAFLDPQRSATAVVVTAPAAVSDDAAKQAFADAQKLASGPVTVTYGAKRLNVERSAVAAWIVFDRMPLQDATATAGADPAPQVQRFRLTASFDATRVGGAIATLTDGLGTPARDASFSASGGKVVIKPSKVGRGPDLASLAQTLRTACLSGAPRIAAVRLVETQPKLTTDAARAMGISDRISTFTTRYSSANPARVNNVHLLARAFDMKLVAPGATFSFNGTAGERTAAKGYEEAPAIVDGKLVPQLGGGVCQVGTTFFNAVFFSGLPVVERHNHSFFISHYPKGRDATVSWGGPDFKFKNDTGGWILIRTAYTSTSLTVALYGTDPGYQVEYTTSSFTDVVPFRTSEVEDPKLAQGAKVVEDPGVNGGRVTVVRTVYKGGVVVRKDTFLSRYASKTQVVRVGTKAPSGNTTSTPKP